MNKKYQLTVEGKTAGIIAENWQKYNYPFNLNLRKSDTKRMQVIELDDAEYTRKLADIYGVEPKEVGNG